MNEFRARIMGGTDGEASPLVPVKNPKGANGEAGLRTVAVPRFENRTSDTRDGDRHRLADESATVTHDGTTYDVRLVNVSGGGAMISGAFEPLLFDRVDLNLKDGHKLQCVVQWVRDDRIGLQFAQETHIDCSPAERDALLRNVIASSFPEVAAAEISQEPLQTEEPAADEDEPVEDSQRAEPRHPLIWSGVIHFNYATTPVRLRNISSQGALIECSEAVPEGAELLLDLGDAGSLFATVSWTVGDQIGLKFQQPFDMQLLAKTRPEVASTQWEMPTYLKGNKNGQSDPWQQMSATEINEEMDGFLKR